MIDPDILLKYHRGASHIFPLGSVSITYNSDLCEHYTVLSLKARSRIIKPAVEFCRANMRERERESKHKTNQ